MAEPVTEMPEAKGVDTMIYDFHSHVLPGVDDGSASLDESIGLLRMEAEQGIGHVVATPHFYPRYDSPEKFLARRREAELRLREEMEKHTGLPRLTMGAEVYFFPGISESDVLSELTIGKNGYILIEMPQPPWSERAWRELAEISYRQGLTPILAHIDRYIGPLRTYGIPQRLQELPVLVQANAEFFRGPLSGKMAMGMLRRDQIHLLGSDCHNLTTRKPDLDQAIRKIRAALGEEPLLDMEHLAEQILL
jgi:protein-tyrosine phosphatase